jgi:hypothetical protein
VAYGVNEMSSNDQFRDPSTGGRPLFRRTSTLLLLGTIAAFAFVLVVYGITNSVGPDAITNVSAVTRTPAP